jgi:ribosomal protein S6--L-glutamate ligase
MIVSLNPCLDADEYILTGSRPLSREEVKLISKAKAVLLPQGCSKEIHATCVAAGPAIFPEYGPRFLFPGKIGQNLLFKRHRLPHPRTLTWQTSGQFLAALNKNPRIHPRPFIIKRNLGHEGYGVFLIEDDSSLSAAMAAVAPGTKGEENDFITQDFVPPGGAALRIVIIGSKAISYWKRSRSEKDKIATISRDAVVDHSWKPELQAEGIELCKAMSLRTGINLAAVDLVFPLEEPEPAPKLLEINYFFGRRGLGGSENYYHLLLEAVREWLSKLGLDPGRVRLA